jgi:hypothetical protein
MLRIFLQTWQSWNGVCSIKQKYNIMKKTRLLLMALCAGAITSFTACAGGETKEEGSTDSATYQDNVVPPTTDTTSTMTDCCSIINNQWLKCATQQPMP